MGTHLPTLPLPPSPTPNFRPMSVVAKQLGGSRRHLVGTRKVQAVGPGDTVRWRLCPFRGWGGGWVTHAPLPTPERGTAVPHFRSILWPTDSMDQAATSYQGIGLGPGDIMLDGDPAPPKGAQPPFPAHVCCGQTAGWIKMPLGIRS